MNSPNKVIVKETNWHTAKNQLARIRREVFIVEQNVPENMEWDGLDENAIHLLAFDEDKAIGCARILCGGIIGRMAVLADYRRLGIGSELLKHAIGICHLRGWQSLSLSAQTHAIGFYEMSGFIVSSGVYLDAGIPHCDMALHLARPFAGDETLR